MNTSTKEKLSRRPRRRSTWVDEDTGRQVRRCARCQRVRDLETDFPPDRPHGKKPSNRYHYRCFNCMWRKMPEVSEDEELRRIDEALERERQGVPLPFPDPDEPAPTRRGPRVPGRPLAEAVDRLIASQQMDHPWSWPSWNFTSLPPHDSEGFSEATCLRLGLWQRRLLDWRKGGNVEVPMADAVLTRSNWMWWDVWNERTVRMFVFRVRRYRFGIACGFGMTMRYRVFEGAKPYADVPDPTELARVARAFGDDLEETAA